MARISTKDAALHTPAEVQDWVEGSIVPAALTGWQATLDARIEDQLLITPEPPPWIT